MGKMIIKIILLTIFIDNLTDFLESQESHSGFLPIKFQLKEGKAFLFVDDARLKWLKSDEREITGSVHHV